MGIKLRFTKLIMTATCEAPECSEQFEDTLNIEEGKDTERTKTILEEELRKKLSSDGWVLITVDNLENNDAFKIPKLICPKCARERLRTVLDWA